MACSTAVSSASSVRCSVPASGKGMVPTSNSNGSYCRVKAPRAPADIALTFALLIFSMITVAAGAYSPFLYFRF